MRGRSQSRSPKLQRQRGIESGELLNGKSECEEEEIDYGGGRSGGGNRVMVVVDSRVDGKAALQWALSHTLQTQDTLLLLYVAKPPKSGR